MSMFDKEMRIAVEFLPERLYYVALSSAPPTHNAQKHFFSIDNEMVYWNFYLDFGPLNLGHLYRYCALLNNKLNDPKHKDKVIYYYSSSHPHRRTNAAFLICAWSILYLNRSPEDAWKPFKNYPAPFPPWHDATPTACSFNLTVLDTLKGLYKAREVHFFDFANFNIEEYEHYEQVENGDLNWYVEGKFIAFAGPHAEKEFSPGGYYSLRPDDYIKYFKAKNVQLVVRLNKSYYDPRRFSSHGIEHMDMYFLDGSNPPEAILTKFIQKCEEVPGAIAVHCKAGLGRTGTVIGCYIMKHYKFTAEEIIGWMRIVRPGSIIGPQQQFMREMQGRMWREGDLFRASKQTLQSLTLANDIAVAKLSGSNSGQSISNNSNGSGNVAGSEKAPVSGMTHSSSRNALNNNSHSSVDSPTSTPQLSRKLNNMSLTGSTASSSKDMATSSSAKSSPYGTRQSTVASLRSSYLGAPSSTSTGTTNSIAAAENARSANSTPTSAASAAISGYFRKTPSTSTTSPSSRTTSSNLHVEGDEDDKDANTQGDLLRIRRQQHINTVNTQYETAGDSLSNCVTPNSRLSAKDLSYAPTLVSGAGGGSSAKYPQTTSNNTSASNTPTTGSSANTPSKFSSFLSWNSKV